MTATEKAKELVGKFDALDFKVDGVDIFCHNSTECALIVVEEILNLQEKYLNYAYWEKVKLEIKKL